MLRILYFLALVVASALAVPACAAPGGAGENVQHLYDALLGTMKDGSALGIKGRYERLKPVIGGTFDLPFMARAVVGPTWTSLPADQQRAMTDAFRRFVTATYANRFANYGGQKFQVTGELAHGADTVVDSLIVKSDGKPVSIRYLMHRNGDSWLVADIYLGGTISELVTRRSEFSSVLRQQGIDGLIATLNQKTAMLAGDTAR